MMRKSDRKSPERLKKIREILKTTEGKTIVKSCCVLLLIGVLLGVWCSTFAWFSSSRASSVTGMEIRVYAPYVTQASLRVFPVTEINESTRAYTFLDNVTVDAIPILDEHDLYGGSGYRRAVVLEFTLNSSSVNSSVILQATTSKEWTYSANNYFSNCCTIAPAAVSGAVATVPETGAQSYVSLVTAPAGSEYDMVPQKVSSGVLSFPVPTLQVGENKVYFVLRYNENMLYDLMFLGLPLQGDSDGVTHYSNDISFSFSGVDK